MLKLPRLIRGEMNKIFMRPILYILTIFLVFALVLSFTIFNPTNRVDTKIDSYNECKTFAEVQTQFLALDTTNPKGKKVADANIVAANSILNTYTDISTVSTRDELLAMLTVVDNHYKTYKQEVNSGDVSRINYWEQERQHIISNLKELKLKYENYVSESETYPRFIIQQEYDTYLATNFKRFLTIVNQSIDVTNPEAHAIILEGITSGGYITNIKTYLSLIEDIKIKTDDMKVYKAYVEKASEYMDAVYNEMLEIMATGSESEDLGTLITCAKNYYLSSLNVLNLTKNMVYYYPISNYNDYQIHKYYRYNNIYSYELKEDLTRQIYLVNNDKTILDFANTFSSSVTSNQTANAFDFVYFGLEIFGFVIIVFAVILGAGMVAGEYNSGTLKLLIVRPYSRHKIIISKIIATMLISTIFVIFSAIVLFLIGLWRFGANFTPVLAVFNSTVAFSVSPVVLLLIYLATLLFKILIYTLFAVAVSVLFKSNVAAVSISIIVYFFSTVFNALFQSAYWYSFWPFCNMDLFKYMGGSFIIAENGNNILSNVVSSTILYNSSFFFSLGISLLFGLICAIIAHVVFAKREIR